MTGPAPTSYAPPSADADAAARALLGSLNHPDPYPAYARLRSLAPVYVPPVGPVLLTSWSAVETVLHAPQAGKDSDARFRSAGHPDWREHPGLLLMYTSILQLDGADHARLRALVSRVFTPRRVEAMRADIARVAGRLTSALEPGDVDLVEAWALPLPVAVIGDLLGVPEADRAGFGGWVSDFALALEPALGPAELARCDAAAVRLTDYFRELVAQRRRRPTADLTSALAALDTLTESELLGMLSLLFAAGFETTTQLLSKSVAALNRHPDELARWRADPGLGANAVEELLRFDSPVQLNSRVLRADVEADGVSIPAGRIVYSLLAAANRDPARFADPDRLDLGRAGTRSMSFGGGPHFCLGAALARAETSLALPMFFTAFDVEVGRPEQRPGLGLHGYARLPVRLTRRN